MEINKIYNEDCIEGMKKIPSASIDMVLTDPIIHISNCSRIWKAKKTDYQI